MVGACLMVAVCCGTGAVVIRVGPVAGNDTRTPETRERPTQLLNESTQQQHIESIESTSIQVN